MRILCFGGSLDREVINVEPNGTEFKRVVPDPNADAYMEETYRFYRGRKGGDEWRFAALAGIQPTDEMALDSQPARLTEMERSQLAKAREAIEQKKYDDALHFVTTLESALLLSRQF